MAVAMKRNHSRTRDAASKTEAQAQANVQALASTAQEKLGESKAKRVRKTRAEQREAAEIKLRAVRRARIRVYDVPEEVVAPAPELVVKKTRGKQARTKTLADLAVLPQDKLRGQAWRWMTASRDLSRAKNENTPVTIGVLGLTVTYDVQSSTKSGTYILATPEVLKGGEVVSGGDVLEEGKAMPVSERIANLLREAAANTREADKVLVEVGRS